MERSKASLILSFEQVSKVYRSSSGEERVALRAISFEVPAGRTVAVVGRSGSGKSTLLHLAAGIDTPTSGRVLIGDSDLAELPDQARTLLRRKEIGLIFQFFHLLPHLSVLDNVVLPELIAGGGVSRSRERAESLLEQVELRDRAEDNIQELSGGEMQRVAICRALLRRPELLLADEPTGNLDDESGARVMEILLDLAAQEGSTLIYVTHSLELAARADEVWQLHSGVLERS